MPFLFDTHFHLDADEDVDTVIAEAEAAGVKYLAAIASDLDESRRLAQLQQCRPRLFSSAGVHPHGAETWTASTLPFKELFDEFDVAAVGEIGLDYYYEFSNRTKQRQVFAEFLTLASQCARPAIIHCRNAEEDCFHMLHEYADDLPRVVIHSYTGSNEWLEKFLELGAFISYNGIVTFKRADNVRELLAHTPRHRLLLETDAPYLAPMPHRGKRNRPAWIRNTAEFVADFLKIPFAELAATTTENAQLFFGMNP